MNLSDEQILVAIRRKRSTSETARTLGISEDECSVIKQNLITKYGSLRKAMMREIIEDEDVQKDIYITQLEDIITENINLDKGIGSYSGLVSDKPLSPEEIEQKYKIDKTKWRLSAYWNKEQPNGKYFVSANVSQLKNGEVDIESFQNQFKEYLSTIPSLTPTPIEEHSDWGKHFESPTALIIPSQDAHKNKYDILGDNNIHKRFKLIKNKLQKLVHKAKVFNRLEEIIYVVGSDEFNSEYSGNTTKGTPQQNILTYEGGFSEICQHEVDIINFLSQNCETLIIKYVPGNHDHYVGWHLITWLQAYFRQFTSIHFDTSMLCRKYHRYGNSGIQFNHGDVLKFKELAGLFPHEFKEQWGKCSHFTIFTGDKHHEKSVEIQGINCYQLPQLSNARSSWDDKQGYTLGKAEMVAYVVSKDNGITDILKEIL